MITIKRLSDGNITNIGYNLYEVKWTSDNGDIESFTIIVGIDTFPIEIKNNGEIEDRRDYKLIREYFGPDVTKGNVTYHLSNTGIDLISGFDAWQHHNVSDNEKEYWDIISLVSGLVKDYVVNNSRLNEHEKNFLQEIVYAVSDEMIEKIYYHYRRPNI